MIVNIHRINHNNTGDMASSPLDYFDLGPSIRIDIQTAQIQDYHGLVIFGGGGLFRPGWIEIIKGICAINRYCFWGVGINNTSPPDLKLEGIRDIYPNSTWVPCASCMSKLFDKVYPIKEDVVMLKHTKQPLPNFTFRTLDNNRQFEEIIEFLGSANIVITNSYHGVYWATLLGKKVLCVSQYNKFNYMKYRVPVCRDITLDDFNFIKDEIETFPNALQECREANINHFKRVSVNID